MWLAGGDDGFIAALTDHCPPLAHIDNTNYTPHCWTTTPQNSAIHESGTEYIRTRITPDAAVCPARLAEIDDSQAHHYYYPSVDCTHYGSRLTIIRAIPYDRPFTVMAPFLLYSPYEVEFRNPADHRFHTQPVAYPDYGLWLE